MIKDILLPLIRENYSNTQIAKIMNVSKPTVARWIKQLRDQGVEVYQRPKGKKNVLSERLKTKIK